MPGTALPAAVALAALCGAGPDRPGQARVKPAAQWSGLIGDGKLRREAPKGGVITDARAFERLWKAWRKGKKLPEVDFTKQFVFVTVADGPNVPAPLFTLDAGGNLSAGYGAGLERGKGFGYSIAALSREGVARVNGLPLPKGKPKPKPEEPPGD